MLTTDEIKTKTPDEIQLVVANLLAEKERINAERERQFAQKEEQLMDENARLRHQLNLLLHHRFGRKAEQQENPDQALLFDEADIVDENQSQSIESADENITIAAYQRTKPGRKPLPKDLPRIRQEHDLPEAEKQCACGCSLTKISEVKSEQLEFIPAQARVIEHVRFKYACKQCEETIKIAPLPKQPIPKSIATSGLLSHVLISKFCDHLPFYRQERMMQRMGIDIDRATLCHWAQKCGVLLKPLIDQMHEEIKQYDIGYADETTLQVLKEKDRPAHSTSYMWLFIGGPPEKRSFIYQYDPSRRHEIAKTFWGDFNGYLHTDGYSGYQTLFNDPELNIRGVHCWAHARRKYIEVTKSCRKEGLAHKAVKQIAKLYALESKFKEQKLKPDVIYQARQKKSKPLLDRFKRWLDDNINHVPPKSPIGRAMSYSLKYWNNLTRYLEDGRLEIDNNRAERSIKPFVIGRKNWMFHDSVKGAEAGAIIYSLIETCKVHTVEPYAYFKYVLSNIVHCDQSADIEKLLPYNIDPAILQNQWRTGA